MFLKSSHGALGISIGLLMREVFSGGPSIALKVKDDQIVSIMNFLFINIENEAFIPTKVTLVDALIELLLVRKCNYYSMPHTS